jgi:hypothetical protein
VDGGIYYIYTKEVPVCYREKTREQIIVVFPADHQE